MSIALEIVTDAESIDLDPWCQFAQTEGRVLVGTMRFGTEVIGTDTPAIIAAKKDDAARECDAFLDLLEPFVGQVVTVVYEATKVATVQIPEDCGLSATGDQIRWPLAVVEAPPAPATGLSRFQRLLADKDMELYEAMQRPYELLEAMQILTAAVNNLASAISGAKKKPQ